MNELIARYKRADKLWLAVAAICLFFGAIIPSGFIGMIMLLVAKGYLDMSEGKS